MLAVERDGELTLFTVGEFAARVGVRISSVKCKLAKLHLGQRLDQKKDGEEEGPPTEAHKRAALTFLQENMTQLAERETRCQKREEKEAKARQTYAVLPSVEALEKLGRYESMLNRQLFRAMKELRTLQEKRKNPKSDQSKSERNPNPEDRSENLPNEAISPFPLTPTLSRPTGEGEDGHASRQDQCEGAIDAADSLAHPMGEGQGEGSAKLPNEPIPASAPSEISNLRSQMTGNLPNEATDETGNE